MSSPGFTDRHLGQTPRELPDYQSISAWAVCTLLLGILSVSALAHPAAWIIPVLAVICGVVAQFRISRRADVVKGHTLAVIGMSLGLFFGVWAVSRQATESFLLSRSACSFAEQWLQTVLDKDLEAAHQATLDYFHRQPEGTLLDEYYQDHPDDLNAMQEFFSDGRLKDVVRLNGEATIRFDEIIGVLNEPDANYVSLRFFVNPNDKQQPVLHLQIELLRLIRADGIYWSLLSAEDASLFQRSPR